MQYRTLVDAIENENNKRSAVSSAENWMAEAKAAFKELNPGSRFRLTLGKEDISAFSYNAVLLDACQGTDAFNYHCGIFLVPKVCICSYSLDKVVHVIQFQTLYSE